MTLDVALLALVVTKLTDLIRTQFDPRQRAPAATWIALALGLGVAVALIWDVTVFPRADAVQLVAGEVLTGLVIGAGASGWHELLDLFSSTAKRAKHGPGAPPGS